jgi:hypothetical protein
MEALGAINRICHETGVCESEAILLAPGAKHAAELYKEGSSRAIRVICWDDGMVSSCVIEKGKDGKVKEKVCCYTSESGGPELYWAWIAHLCSDEVGYKEKRIEVD